MFIKGSVLSFGLVAEISGLWVSPRNRDSGLSGRYWSMEVRMRFIPFPDRSGVCRPTPEDVAEPGRR